MDLNGAGTSEPFQIVKDFDGGDSENIRGSNVDTTATKLSIIVLENCLGIFLEKRWGSLFDHPIVRLNY